MIILQAGDMIELKRVYEEKFYMGQIMLIGDRYLWLYQIDRSVPLPIDTIEWVRKLEKGRDF